MKRLPPSKRTYNPRRFVQSGNVAAELGLTGRAVAVASTHTGERPLYLAIYRPGPGWLPNRPTSEQPLRDHGRYMLQLYCQGCMKFAGAFADHSGGAAAFEAEDDQSARSIVDVDPAVSMGAMICTVQRWNLLDWASLASSIQRATERKP